MSFTNQEVNELYETFKQAYLALASGVKSYTINVGGSSRRSIIRADLTQIKKEFVYWAKIPNQRHKTQGLDVSYIEPVDV